MSDFAGRKNASMTPASVAWMPLLYMHTHSSSPTTMYGLTEYTRTRDSAASSSTAMSEAAIHAMSGVCP